MIKRNDSTLSYHLFNNCLFLHTVDIPYAIDILVENITKWNSKFISNRDQDKPMPPSNGQYTTNVSNTAKDKNITNEKSNDYQMDLYIYSSQIGLIKYETSISGNNSKFRKLKMKKSEKAIAGQEEKDVVTVKHLIQTVKAHSLTQSKGPIKSWPIILMYDFPDFSFPEDWFQIKYEITIESNWQGSFVILSNRRDKVPSFMERLIKTVYLSDLIEYNANRLPNWKSKISKILDKLHDISIDSLSFRIEDRINSMTSQEFDNTISMLEATKDISKDEVLQIIDYLTKIPSKELAKENHVRLIMDNNASFEELGGLERLKNDMEEAAQIFINADSENIRKHNVPIPKSIILQGIQGGGKTATAKAIANKFKARFAIFNMADIFSGRLGDTEANIQSALNTFKELAPVVVLVDECDKSMVGIESSGRSDGGTTARAIQTYLTFLSEPHDKVFLVHTANELDRLPPEFLRRGRHDNIYFVDAPTRKARESIFRIHLKLLGTSQDKINELMKNDVLLDISDQFTGAEIEEAIKSAKRKAFVLNPEICEITEDLLISALENTKAICNVDPEKINKIREWGLRNAILASYTEEEITKSKQHKPQVKKQKTSFS